MTKEILTFCALMKIATVKKVNKIVVPNFKDSLPILALFYKKGYIFGYMFLKNQKIEIYLKYDTESKSVINDIITISKPHYAKILRLRDIKQLLKTNRLICGVLRTHKGIKTLDECLASDLGGQFLFYIT